MFLGSTSSSCVCTDLKPINRSVVVRLWLPHSSVPSHRVAARGIASVKVRSYGLLSSRELPVYRAGLAKGAVLVPGSIGFLNFMVATYKPPRC